jgi:hypothetical protein
MNGIKRGDMNGITNGIRIELNIFARIVYPGAITWTFLYLRYGDSLCITQLNAIFIPLSLIIGVVLYAFYRGVVLFPAILWIEDKTVGVPQYEFYRGVVNQMKFRGKINKEELKKMKWAAACAAKVLTLHAPPKFKDALYSFNSFVHVPFITSFVAFLVFWHDLYRYLQSSPGYEIWWLWIIICIGFLGIGIAFDCLQSNPREAAFLIQRRKDYEEFITELASYYGWKNVKGKSAQR